MAEIDQLARVVLALVEPVINALIVLVILFLVARPVVKALGRPRATKDDRIETLARGTVYEPREDRTDGPLPAGPARQSGRPEAAQKAVSPAAGQKTAVAAIVRADARLMRARTLALALFDKNPERGIALLKTWLKQEA